MTSKQQTKDLAEEEEEEKGSAGQQLMEDWTRLRQVADVACKSLVAAGVAAGQKGGSKKRAANNLQTRAERFGRNLEFLVRRLERQSAEDRQRLGVLERENEDLLDRVVRLRQNVPAPLRRSSMRCRAAPLIMSAYSIDKIRHVARSGHNVALSSSSSSSSSESDQQQQVLDNPIKGRGVEKSRYRKKVQHVVVNVSLPDPGPDEQ